ncbi:MAG TPA: HAD family hydrolase [Anaerolineae bacterium]
MIGEEKTTAGRAISGEGLLPLEACSDGIFRPGEAGVQEVLSTRDGKVEFIVFAGRTLAYVKSALGYPAYYPVRPVRLARPVRAVLMDLDGTTVRSEGFWMAMIERTVADLRGDPGFRLTETDHPFVAGHSVSEHLSYCLDRYCPGRTLEEARARYFGHTRRELAAIAEGGGSHPAFAPAPGLADFLLALKARQIKIALVTSGLWEKAWPEILSAFRTIGLGDPRDFYDAIISAGASPAPGQPGTLGELEPKPHPWLYAEACRVGLGLPADAADSVVGIEDSSAGVCAIRLAGFPTIGLAGGNIEAAGVRSLCEHYCTSLDEVLAAIG